MLNIKSKINNLRKQIKKSKEQNSKIDNFKENFRRIMFEKGIYDSFDRTVTPKNIKLIETNGANGISCELDFPLGLCPSDLDKALDSLKENLYGSCMIILEKKDSEKMTLTAINKWFDTDYTPVPTDNASQIFLGYDMACEPAIVNLSKYPHLIITGGSGGGKSKMVEVALTNLAYNNSPDELELYFLQIAKDDQFRYELLKHTKGCITSSSGKDTLETLYKALQLLEYIDKEISRREKLVKGGLGRKAEDQNIHVYNKKYPDKKMPVLMLWIDEAASLYEINQTMPKEERVLRNRADSILKRIAQTGRYIGVYMINVMQRASKDEMPRGIKINLLNKVSFNQIDKGASMVAIDHESAAIGLPTQVFAYRGGTSDIYYAKTPYSNWSKNLKLLSKKGLLRKDNDRLILQSYSHWLEPNIVEKSKPTTTKVKDVAISKMNEEMVSLQNKLDAERDKNMKLLKQISDLMNNKNSIRLDLDNYKYTNASKQKEDFVIKNEYVNNSFENVKVKINKR